MWLLTRSNNYFKILSWILLLLQLLLRRLNNEGRLLLLRESSWVRVACGYSCGKLNLRGLINRQFCWSTCCCWAAFEVIAFYYLNSRRRPMPKLPSWGRLKQHKFAIGLSYFIDCECIYWWNRVLPSLHRKFMRDTFLFNNRSKRLISVSNCGDFSSTTIFIAIFINLLQVTLRQRVFNRRIIIKLCDRHE